ncbi:saccharopine dehydrogenase family protein [Halopiger goleimassiliensis]|uniref:saccharopine dehydrogenase family protein n=1 Tax=Halopiger goleimassiliensis TaxID=1293048 RepID=UPI0006781CEF|nr:saccharopine dehydrogenase NADP-binding domain-containing protein [Halopiger goleimassiliensis]
MSSVLIYGSYGFVGSLVAREAIDRGLEVVLAGRDPEAVREQVEDLERPGRRFALEESDVVREALAGADVDCVLNCAGPFSNTAEPLVEACVETGTEYVDITGEIPVIEGIADRDEAAREAGVTLVPAAAFSAVPMDCLAAHLAERLPDPDSLALGVDSLRPPSIGTVRTVIEGAEDGGAVYRNGRLEHVPAAWRTRRIDFGRGYREGVTMPTGDVATAHYTTGISNVAVYVAIPQPARSLLKLHRYVAPIVAAKPVSETLKAVAGLVREGPSSWSRERGSAYVWGEARDEYSGERVVSRLRTPDPYVLTVDAAVTAVERVLETDLEPGFRTPAGAFGPEFVLDLEGVAGFFDEGTPDTESPRIDVAG